MAERAHAVREATAADAEVIARLLDAFNREFDEPSPGAEFLAGRVAELIDAGEAAVLLIGEGPEGLAVLRFRPALWGPARDALVEELYVVPGRRGEGLGQALLEACFERAREAGADRIELNTGETDTAARALYEKNGFTNAEGGEEGVAMLYYEREL